MNSVFLYLRDRSGDHLELAGWALVILLLPLSYSFGRADLSGELLAFPVAIYLARKFGRTGLRLFAVFGVPMLFADISMDGGLQMNAHPWIYLSSVTIAYVAAEGRTTLHALRAWPIWRLAALMLILPVSFTIYGFGGDWLALTFRFNAASAVFVLVGLCAAAGMPRQTVIGLVAVTCGVGALLGWALSLVPELGSDPSNAALYWDMLNLRYPLDSLGDVLEAVVIYEVVRFLASFDRGLPRSLPGRRLPDTLVSLGLIMGLTLLVYWPWSLSPFWPAFSNAAPLEIYFGDVVFLVACFLAGFLLRILGALLMLCVMVSGLAAEEILDRAYLNILDVALPFALGFLGQLWREHVRGEPAMRLHPVWVRYGLLMGLVVISLMFIVDDLIAHVNAPQASDFLLEERPRDRPIVVEEAPDTLQNLILAYGLPLWLAIMIGTRALLLHRKLSGRGGLQIEGNWLSLLNLALLVGLAYTFSSTITQTFTILQQALFFVLQGDLFFGDVYEGFGVYFSILGAIWAGLLALSLFLRATVDVVDRLRQIVLRRRFTLTGAASDLPGALGWATRAEPNPFGIQAIRALGMSALITPAAMLLAAAFFLLTNPGENPFRSAFGDDPGFEEEIFVIPFE